MKYSTYKIFKERRGVQEIFEAFRHDAFPFLLESSKDVDGMGRYSFLGSDPFLVLDARGETCVLTEGSKERVVHAPALMVMKELFQGYRLETAALSVPFLCGAVGFFSYDFGFTLEKFKRNNAPDPFVPDVSFAFYDCLVVFDHLKKEVILFSSGFPEKGRLRAMRAKERFREVLKKLEESRFCAKDISCGDGVLKKPLITSNFTKSAYLDAVRAAKNYIANGDIYQVNLSQRLSSCCSMEDWLLYKKLARSFPVSFSAFLKHRDFSIISASPERFLNFDGRVVTTRPMKGTRKKTLRHRENVLLKKELRASPKERAELLMIVDLERNDLGRVCDYGTIRVRSPRAIETYSNVFQATAEVEGVLHKGKGRFDLIRACFPGGSVTGCPKIRAMEIIEELEPGARGIYTGSLGYLSFHNTLELNVLIRSFLKKGDDVVFNVGGGIVADSKPSDEYEETLIKAAALKEALIGTRP